jgi:hypothetical protein
LIAHSGAQAKVVAAPAADPSADSQLILSVFKIEALQAISFYGDNIMKFMPILLFSVSISVAVLTVTGNKNLISPAEAQSNQCNAIQNSDRKNYCRARTSNQINYCNAIEDNDRKNFCRAEIGNNRNQCNAIEDQDMRNECRASM